MTTFRSRLLLWFLPLLALAVVPTALVGHGIARRQLDRAFSERLTASLAGMAGEFEEVGADLLDQARRIDPAALLPALTAGDADAIRSVLARFRSGLQCDAIRLVNRDAVIVFDSSRHGSMAQKTGERAILDALAGRENGSLVVSATGVGILGSLPLLRGSEVAGALCLERTMNHRFLRQIHRKFGLDCTLHAGDHVQATTLRRLDVAEMAALDAVRSRALQTQRRVEDEVRLAGEPVQVVCAPIIGLVQPTDVVLTVSLTKTSVERSIATMTTLFVVIGLGLLLLVAFVSAGLARRVVRPVVQLAEAARAVGRGEPVDLAVRSGDEFELLANAFTAMQADLRASTTSIDNLNREIGVRKTAERALADERERLAVTLRSIGDGVVTTDLGGRVTLVNKVAERLLGWQQDEAAGRPLPEVFRIVDAFSGMPRQNPVDKVLATGQIVRLANHTNLVSRSGEMIPIADSGAPIFDHESRIIGAVLVFRDVREEYRRDEERLRMKKLESVGVLAGGIAHDFNNILTAIAGNLNLAANSAGLAPVVHELLTEAERATGRARSLTGQLLTFAKGGNPIREVSSLPELIVDSTEFILRGSNVRSEYDFAPGLWNVRVDRGQISQVVQNIVLNARQAMVDGGTVKIACENRLRPAASGDGAARFVRIAIADTGSGIPADVLDRIFDPYFTTKNDGSGLGLAICHSIVTRHDGQLTVKSTPDVGTTFEVLLPAAEADAVVAGGIGPGPAEPLPGGRALVMDDDEMVASATRRMLERLGFDVEVVANGEQALELYARFLGGPRAFHVVLIDLTVRGGMGGAETMHGLRALDPAVRAIVVSGYSTDPIMADCRAHGFRAAVTKPFRIDDLREALRQTLAGG